MGCFNLLNNPLEYLFYALSLFQAYRALQLAGVIRKEWQSVRQEPLTRHKLSLADQAAFYLAVPPAVLVHEVFHAIPIYGWGGRVVNCGYGFYWGFVQADRVFSAPQEWFIALAGTLGSLLIGLLYWLLLRRHPSSAVRFFGLRAMRFQVYFSLLYYPIFTVISFIGDWRTIYNFEATPVLSWATAVAHITLLALYYWADRNGRFEMVAHESAAAQEQFAALQTQATMNPHDTAVQLQYVDYLRRGAAPHQAKTHLKQALQEQPNSAEGLWQLTLLELDKKQTIPQSSVANIQKALELGLSDSQRPQAHFLLGRYYFDRGQGDTAVEQFTQAIEGKTAVSPAQQINYRYWRTMAYRRQQQFERAYQDMQYALKLAQNLDDQTIMTRLQDELKLIEQHAGRPLGTSANTPEGGDV
jgi:tetratricopeptide (TPR) repeat protein